MNKSIGSYATHFFAAATAAPCEWTFTHSTLTANHHIIKILSCKLILLLHVNIHTFNFQESHLAYLVIRISQNHIHKLGSIWQLPLQSHTSTVNSVVQWLEWLTAKKVIWVQSSAESVNFVNLFLKIYRKNYQKSRLNEDLLHVLFFRFWSLIGICQISQNLKLLKNVVSKEATYSLQVPNRSHMYLLKSNVKLYWWSLLSLTNLTNWSSLQNGKTQLC